MAFLHLNFDNFEFRDLGHSDFLSFKLLAPTRKFVEFAAMQIFVILKIENFSNRLATPCCIFLDVTRMSYILLSFPIAVAYW